MMNAVATPSTSDGVVSSIKHRVLIADDHPLMLRGLRHALENTDDIEIVGEAHTGPEVVGMIERRRPSLVLLDLRMPGVSGTECLEEIVARWPEVKVVVISASEDRSLINASLDAGASAYVVKSVTGFDVAAVIRQTSTGAVFHASSRTRPRATAEPEPAPDATLTERELAILQAVTAGLTTAAISRQLWVSEHTVKFHLTNIYRKLGVNNRAGAIRYALEHSVAAA